MAVWFMRWLQGTLWEQCPLFDVGITTDAGITRTSIKHSGDDALRAQERARFYLLSAII